MSCPDCKTLFPEFTSAKGFSYFKCATCGMWVPKDKITGLPDMKKAKRADNSPVFPLPTSMCPPPTTVVPACSGPIDCRAPVTITRADRFSTAQTVEIMEAQLVNLQAQIDRMDKLLTSSVELIKSAADVVSSKTARHVEEDDSEEMTDAQPCKRKKQ